MRPRDLPHFFLIFFFGKSPRDLSHFLNMGGGGGGGMSPRDLPHFFNIFFGMSPRDRSPSFFSLFFFFFWHES